MKKTILLLSSVVMSLGAFAQNFTATWEKPAAPEFTSFEAETEFYMWNVGAGGFYINHQGGTSAPYYGTAASVNDTIGAVIKITRTNPDASAVESNWTEGTENSYLLVNYVTKFKEFRCSFADGWVWTDNNTNPYRYFDVVAANNKLTITPNQTLIVGAGAEIGESWVANPIGVKADDAEKMVRISADGEDWYTEWACVAPETYTAYVESAKEKNKLYSAAVALRKTIEKAISENPGINLDAQVAVYNNTESTVEQLNAAKAEVSTAIVAYTASKATIDNPVNYSSLITNSTFDAVGDFTGWSAGFGAGGAKGPSAECYGKAFDVYQTVKGLPTGVYMVKVNAYFRKENAQNDYNVYSAGTPSDTKLYAKSGSISSEVNVKHICQGGVEAAFGADNENTFSDGEGTSWYVPNTMLAADSYFHNEDGTINPRYENTVYVPVSNGELTIGVANTVGGGNDWSIFDDFQLYYIGDADNCYALLKENLVSNLTYEVPENTVYGEKEYADYTNGYKALVAATGKNALAEYENTKNALDSLQASISSYASYISAYNNASEWYDKAETDGINVEIPEVAKLEEYLNCDPKSASYEFPNGAYSDIINESKGTGKLTNEQIIAEKEYLNNLLKAAVDAGIYEGMDLTQKITNPGFEEAGGKGWTNTYGALTNWHGGNANNYCAEAWNSNFNVYQDVEGLANGLYEVSVQAFYRTAANATAYEAYNNDPDMVGDAKVLSYVYFNEFATPIRNVMEIQYDDNLANNCYATSDGKYTLNGMTSASTAFSMEEEDMNFTMKVYGIVSDGKMRLGIRNTEGSIYDRWTLWDNFKLRYMGKNKVAVASVLKTNLNKLDAIKQKGENMNSATITYIDNELVTPERLVGGLTTINEKAVELLDKEELWNALVALGRVQTEVDKDIESYKAYKAAMSKMENISSDGFTQAMQTEWYALEDINVENMTRAEIDEVTKRYEDDYIWFTYPERYAKAVTPDEIPAIDEEKESTDFTGIIQNPDFDSLEGWVNSGEMSFQTQTNSAFAKTGNTYCELWHKDAFLNLSQSFITLPAGYYTLTADCYNSTADGSLYISVEKEKDGKVVVEEATKFIEDTKDATKQDNYSVTFYYDGNGILTFGYKGHLTSSTWMCIDNINVYYSRVAPSTAIEAINSSAAKCETGIFSITGTRNNKLMKGLNIVQMSDGSVKKIFVK